jgi:two-component system KDP operon response regulator KdpE
LIELGDFRIDVERHQVMVRDAEVHLTPKEFDLLLYFARNADRVLTHKTLLRAVWGAAGVDQPEYLRVLVAQLRKKIEPDASKGGEPRYILSEPWVGYRLNPGRGGAEKGHAPAGLTTGSCRRRNLQNLNVLSTDFPTAAVPLGSVAAPPGA